jgi:hypothetical protein
VIKIAPGTYTETANVEMKNYVDVEGSGQDVTTIECACSNGNNATAAVISAGQITAEIRHLTINNTGGGVNSIGLFTEDVDAFSMLHVTATAGGSDNNSGVKNYLVSSAIMNNVTATATGGTNARGVDNENSSPTMNNVTATATGGTENIGVRNGGPFASPTMNNVTATATGGTENSGVYTISSYNNRSTPTMNNVTATGTGGTNNYGVTNDGSLTTIRNSLITGDTNSIRNLTYGSAKIANTTLDGTAINNSSGDDSVGFVFACAAVNDANFDELNEVCQ